MAGELAGFLRCVEAHSRSPALPGWRRSADRTCLRANSLLTGIFTEKIAIMGGPGTVSSRKRLHCSLFSNNSLLGNNREYMWRNREFHKVIRDFGAQWWRSFHTGEITARRGQVLSIAVASRRASPPTRRSSDRSIGLFVQYPLRCSLEKS
jgi:hypothetical protein